MLFILIILCPHTWLYIFRVFCCSALYIISFFILTNGSIHSEYSSREPKRFLHTVYQEEVAFHSNISFLENRNSHIVILLPVCGELDWIRSQYFHYKFTGMAAILPWSAPLPGPRTTFAINGTSIDTNRHSFLVSFLQDTRDVDLPPEQAHALLTFLLHTAEESCYRRVGSSGLYFDFFDDIDLVGWARHTERRESVTPFTSRWPSEEEIEAIRNTAVKRWNYTTVLVRRAVGIVARCEDEQGLSRIEKVLFALYHQSLDYGILNNEGSRLTGIQRLNREVDFCFMPRSLNTVRRTICRTQHILERSIFSFWQKERPEVLEARNWTVPAQVELQKWSDWGKGFEWDFPNIFPKEPREGQTSAAEIKRLVTSSRELRNAAAHRQHEGNLDLPLLKLLTDARDFAKALGDDKGATEIEAIITNAHERFQDIIGRQQEAAQKRRKAIEEIQRLKQASDEETEFREKCQKRIDELIDPVTGPILASAFEDYKALLDVDEKTLDGLLESHGKDWRMPEFPPIWEDEDWENPDYVLEGQGEGSED